jgi:hypothetical protein
LTDHFLGKLANIDIFTSMVHLEGAFNLKRVVSTARKLRREGHTPAAAKANAAVRRP